MLHLRQKSAARTTNSFSSSRRRSQVSWGPNVKGSGVSSATDADAIPLEVLPSSRWWRWKLFCPGRFDRGERVTRATVHVLLVKELLQVVLLMYKDHRLHITVSPVMCGLIFFVTERSNPRQMMSAGVLICWFVNSQESWWSDGVTQF